MRPGPNVLQPLEKAAPAAEVLLGHRRVQVELPAGQCAQRDQPVAVERIAGQVRGGDGVEDPAEVLIVVVHVLQQPLGLGGQPAPGDDVGPLRQRVAAIKITQGRLDKITVIRRVYKNHIKRRAG